MQGFLIKKQVQRTVIVCSYKLKYHLEGVIFTSFYGTFYKAEQILRGSTAFKPISTQYSH